MTVHENFAYWQDKVLLQSHREPESFVTKMFFADFGNVPRTRKVATKELEGIAKDTMVIFRSDLINVRCSNFQ